MIYYLISDETNKNFENIKLILQTYSEQIDKNNAYVETRLANFVEMSVIEALE